MRPDRIFRMNCFQPVQEKLTIFTSIMLYYHQKPDVVGQSDAVEISADKPTVRP